MLSSFSSTIFLRCGLIERAEKKEGKRWWLKTASGTFVSVATGRGVRCWLDRSRTDSSGSHSSHRAQPCNASMQTNLSRQTNWGVWK